MLQSCSQIGKEFLEANFLSKQNLHDTVNHIMPESWLRKILPAAVLANKNLTDHRIWFAWSRTQRNPRKTDQIKYLYESYVWFMHKNWVGISFFQENTRFWTTILNQICFVEFPRFYNCLFFPLVFRFVFFHINYRKNWKKDIVL